MHNGKVKAFLLEKNGPAPKGSWRVNQPKPVALGGLDDSEIQRGVQLVDDSSH